MIALKCGSTIKCLRAKKEPACGKLFSPTSPNHFPELPLVEIAARSLVWHVLRAEDESLTGHFEMKIVPLRMMPWAYRCLSVSKYTVLICAASVLLLGCGITPEQRTAIVSFSAATIQVTDVAAEQFVKVRHDTVMLRSRMLALGSDSVKLSNSDADLDGPLNLDELNRRLATLSALELYARLLEQLATDTQSTRLQATSDHLLRSLNGVAPGSITPEQSTAIGKAITKLGGFFIEYKRKNALKEVILGTAEPINKVARLLAEDFDPQRFFWSRALRETQYAITNSLSKQLTEYVVGELQDDEDPKSRKWTEADIALLRVGHQSLVVDSGRVLDGNVQLNEQLYNSLATFQKAHDDIHGLIQLPGFRMKDLNSYLVEIDELVRTAEVLLRSER